MEKNIKRQKIVERDNFTYDERSDICKKSDNKCCHCGKTVFLGYGATIDHYIPLSRGGINSYINLVMLCKDCNIKKANKIIDPEEYLPYLKKEHLDKLIGYYQSYIKSFEYIDRTNLLCCDEYNINFDFKFYPNKHNNKVFMLKSIDYTIEKVDEDNIYEAVGFFIKSIKKLNKLNTEENAFNNILFWYNFGCLYMVKYKGDIKCLYTVVLQQQDAINVIKYGLNYAFIIRAFTYYNNDLCDTIAYHSLKTIIDLIMDEQNIDQIPVNIKFLYKDRTALYVMNAFDMEIYKNVNISEAYTIINKYDGLGEINDNENVQKLFSKFKDLTIRELEDWIYYVTDEFDTLNWMIQDIIYSYDIKKGK